MNSTCNSPVDVDLPFDPTNLSQPETPYKRPQKRHFRSVFISDVHLGTKDCKASELNDFLKLHSFDQLYLVGDIFDGWRMRKGIHWKKSFNRVIARVLKISKNNIPVFYVTGNHDEFLRKFANSKFENILLVNRCDHVTKQGKRILVIHGDQFESVTRCSRALKMVGDHGYEFLMFANRVINHVRSRLGIGFWSFSKFLRLNVGRAKRYIDDYEKAVSMGARKKGYDGVVCGHIHHPSIKDFDGFSYFNTGDWVESCSAIVENIDGCMELIFWLDSPLRNAFITKKKEKIKRITSP